MHQRLRETFEHVLKENVAGAFADYLGQFAAHQHPLTTTSTEPGLALDTASWAARFGATPARTKLEFTEDSPEAKGVAHERTATFGLA